MVSEALKNKYTGELDATIKTLLKFGSETDPANGALEYHGYLGAFTNATISLLCMCLATANGKIDHMIILDDDQWLALMVLVHRTYYTGLQTATEGMCYGFSAAQSKSAIPKPDKFMMYIDSAIKVSNIDSARASYWRNYFHGVRILRNKASHFDSSIKSNEKELLTSAGLTHHINNSGEIQTRPSNYAPLAQAVLNFIYELEESLK